MVWMLIIGSLILVWVISLFKVILQSQSNSPSKDQLFAKGRDVKKRNVLLVIAHPDDESMFFTPTINFLTSRGHNVHILCLSIGDADRKGQIRKHELYQACAVLKVPIQQVMAVDHPNLQDGFGKVWDHNLLAKIVEQEMSSHCIDLVITFDNYGVSGHCNHQDVHYGVRKSLCAVAEGDIEAWELISTNIMRKYCGPVDIWLSMLSTMQEASGTMHCVVNEHPYRSFLAMAQHASQWVWYTRFILFSAVVCSVCIFALHHSLPSAYLTLLFFHVFIMVA